MSERVLVAYVRVSREAQGRSGLGIEAQRSPTRALPRPRGSRSLVSLLRWRRERAQTR